MRIKMFTIGLIVGILFTFCIGFTGTAPLTDPFRRKNTTANELYHLRMELKRQKKNTRSVKATSLELRVKMLEAKMEILSNVPVIKRHIKKYSHKRNRTNSNRRKN